MSTPLPSTNLQALARREGERIGSLARRRRAIEIVLVFSLSFAWGLWATLSGVSTGYAFSWLIFILFFTLVPLFWFCYAPVRQATKLLAAGRVDMAKLALRKAMRINLAFFPLSFWTTVYAVDAQLRMLLSQSHFVEVEALSNVFFVAYQRFRFFHIGNSVDTMLKNYMALSLLGQARYFEAEELFKECLEKSKMRLAKTVLSNNVGYCQLELGQLDEGYATLTAVLSQAGTKSAQDRLIFVALNSNLAKLCVKKSLLDEAELRAETALELAERSKAPASQKGTCYEAFGDLRLAQDRYEEAEHHFRNALDMVQNTYSQLHPIVIRMTNSLARTLEKAGKTKEAHDLFVKAALCEESLQQQIKDSAAAVSAAVEEKNLPLTML